MKEIGAVMVAIASCTLAYGAEQTGASPGLSVGSRVRVTSGSASQVTIGTVAALEADAIVLSKSDRSTSVSIPIRDVQSLDVSLGRRSQAGRGAMIGAAVGAVPGLLLTFGDYSEDVHGDGPSPVAVAAMGAAGGALIGAGIGWALKTDKWLPAQLPKPEVAVVPLKRGVAASIHIACGKGGGRGRRTKG